MKTVKFFLSLAITVALFSVSNHSFAQVASAPYGEVTFVKVNPGMSESYLAAQKVVKKVNNNLIKAKSISSWQLYERVYPVHGSLDFNFAAFVVYPNGKEMEALMKPESYDAAAKELTVKEYQASLGTLPSIRTTVERDLYHYKMGVGGAGQVGDYLTLIRIKATPENLEAYENMLKMLTPVIEEAIKAGKLKSWNVWERTFATNVDGASNLTIGVSYGSLDGALAYESGKINLSDEFKKIYPKEDFAAFWKKAHELREVVSEELWELVDVTD